MRFLHLLQTEFPHFPFKRKWENFFLFFSYLIFRIFPFLPLLIPRHHQQKFIRSITKARNTMQTNKMCYMINHPSERTSWEIFSLRKPESQVNINNGEFVIRFLVLPFGKCGEALLAWLHYAMLYTRADVSFL